MIYAIVVCNNVNDKVYVYCPFHSPWKHTTIPYSPYLHIGDRLLLQEDSSLRILKYYGSIHQRSFDSAIIDELYQSTNSSIYDPNQLQSTGKPLYTQEFRDLTHLDTFTIDPTESRDFDDAISVDMIDHRIFVHIVDIHHQMPIGSTMDITAFEKAFTLYLPDYTHPILPDKFANYEWSLIKGMTRKVITIELFIDPNTLEIAKYDIYPSLIRVKKRYNYSSANKYVEKEEHLQWLDRFAKQWEFRTLMIPKRELHLQNDYLYSTKLEYHHDAAHKIIETLMIATNMIISKHLQQHGERIPQRYHEPVRNIDETYEIDDIITSWQLRKQFSKATYETTKTGHFGLNICSYTHFTSPIRRYFDVIIHRILAGVIYPHDLLVSMLEYLNERERLIRKYVEMYEQWKIYDYLSAYSYNHAAWVIDIDSEKITILLMDFMMEGTIPIQNRTFNIGDQILVSISFIDHIYNQIQYEVVCL